MSSTPTNKWLITSFKHPVKFARLHKSQWSPHCQKEAWSSSFTGWKYLFSYSKTWGNILNWIFKPRPYSSLIKGMGTGSVVLFYWVLWTQVQPQPKATQPTWSRLTGLGWRTMTSWVMGLRCVLCSDCCSLCYRSGVFLEVSTKPQFICYHLYLKCLVYLEGISALQFSQLGPEAVKQAGCIWLLSRVYISLPINVNITVRVSLFLYLLGMLKWTGLVQPGTGHQYYAPIAKKITASCYVNNGCITKRKQYLSIMFCCMPLQNSSCFKNMNKECND